MASGKRAWLLVEHADADGSVHVTDPCPGMPGRLRASEALDKKADIDVIYHPDRPEEPGTGAIQSMVVDLDDWHKLPDMKLAAEILNGNDGAIPFIVDRLYNGAYGPYWLKALVEICTAAYMVSLLPADVMPNAFRYVATDRELQGAISTAHRMGVPHIEIYMIVDEYL